MSPKRTMGVNIPSTPPPGSVLSEHEYQLLDSIRVRMDTLQDVQRSQGERIEALEDAEAKRDETLGRIETKLDGLHSKDQEHDARLDKLAAAFEKKMVKVGGAGAVILAVVGTLTQTADQWGPVLLKLVEILVK